MRVSTNEGLSKRVADLIAPDTGRTTASHLARLAGLSTQSIYNTRDRKPQSADTLEAVRMAVERFESGTGVPPLRREPRSIRIPVPGVGYIVVEDGANAAALARILRTVEGEGDERA